MQDVDRVVETACEQSGLADLGDDDWREGLARLVYGLETEAGLNEVGHVVAESEIVAYLANRLRVIDWRKRHPEISDVDVVPPIVVMGQARTGTTILHDLLAQDPASRVPQAWEVDHPAPPPETATYATDPRIEETENQMGMVDLVIPGFRAMHPVGPQLAQECVRITGSSFRSMIFPTMYRVPSYADWLLHEADMAPSYRWHRAYLEHLQSRHPAQRWVLKSPGHIWTLDALMAEYPRALLVQTHRDPLRIIASISSLMAYLRRLACDDPTVAECAAEFSEYILEGLDRSVEARETGVVPGDRIIDIHFREFMADPLAAIRRIYDAFDLELAQEVETKMTRFLAENPADKHGAHRYSFADTSLDAPAVRERARRYQEYFDVPSEV